jgi:hypothetical protein
VTLYTGPIAHFCQSCGCMSASQEGVICPRCVTKATSAVHDLAEVYFTLDRIDENTLAVRQDKA